MFDVKVAKAARVFTILWVRLSVSVNIWHFYVKYLMNYCHMLQNQIYVIRLLHKLCSVEYTFDKLDFCKHCN